VTGNVFTRVSTKSRGKKGYFDHRLRDDERGEQLSTKIDYIRQNPIAAGLCVDIARWPWIIEPLE
jgi:hypothetical protein